MLIVTPSNLPYTLPDGDGAADDGAADEGAADDGAADDGAADDGAADEGAAVAAAEDAGACVGAALGAAEDGATVGAGVFEVALHAARKAAPPATSVPRSTWRRESGRFARSCGVRGRSAI
jgi:hypothetical protein